jgi:hypothetical protein
MKFTSQYRIIEESNPLTHDKYYKIQEKVLCFWFRTYGLYHSVEDAEKEIIRLHPRNKRVVKTFTFFKNVLWD